MLCFLPPLAPAPRRNEFSPRKPIGGAAATALFTMAVGLALFTPVGWVRSQPVYDLRVGVASRLGPRAEERALLARLSRQVPEGGKEGLRYFASGDPYGAVPPGLGVNSRTGALVGTPAVAGTFTVAIGLSDGAANQVTGPSFKVRVLPRDSM